MSVHAPSPSDALLQQRPTLVLSPHLDDALLSASAVVLTRPCEVWTVFAGEPEPPRTTSWDVSCGFTDSAQTMAARRIEDERAFADTPATTRHLPHLDGAYAEREERRLALAAIEAEIAAWMDAHPGGLVIAPAGAGITVPPAPWHRLATAVRRARRTAPRTATDESVTHDVTRPGAGAAPTEGAPSQAAPSDPRASRGVPADRSTRPSSASPARALRDRVLGVARGVVGRALHAEHVRRRRRAMGEDGLAANPDHLDVRDRAFAAAATRPGITLALFEDLPYLWHARGDDEVARFAGAHGVSTQRVALDVDTDAKHAHLQLYTSQMPVMDTQGRLVVPGHLPGLEVYWIVVRG